MLKRIVPMVISATLVMATFAVTIFSPRASAQDGGVPPEVEQLALQGVESNEDWEPYVQEIDGVEMVLVPSGCFMMGSTDEQVEYADLSRTPQDEQPANQQCFDQPFWIDKYEVTNAQFAQLDGVAASESRWKDDTLPRETINWFEARDFCALRGGHLPTEAEWEYAARGPDNLIFPWGNTFIAENVVYKDNSESTTAEVGSRPGGASWVGALDMSGNVGEWTSSIFMDYPYDATDGREDNNDKMIPRVLRGGSYDLGAVSLRAAARTGRQYTPLSKGYLHGTRCVRSFDGISREGEMSSGQDEQGITVSLTPFESNPVLTVGEPGAWDSGGDAGRF
jgi:formylglycine-generating enzyme required for sulfatase activity